ncbi:MAG: site-specific DNA-methyltransferase [Phycisphaerales bacterium]|nr:site-specific DNA-methyltransferase [Phycisphaerales bacterium]
MMPSPRRRTEPSASAGLANLVGRVHECDCFELLARLPDGCCELIYVDPPFGTGKTFRGHAASGIGFADRLAGGRAAQIAFLLPRLIEMRRVLRECGSLYVHLDYRLAPYIRVELDLIFGQRNFLNEIIWSYRTGSRPGCHFARKHDTILFYARQAGRHVFNLQREGEYRTEGLQRDAEGRAYKTTRRGRLYFHGEGPVVPDVWDIPFLSTVSKERVGYPSQKPLRLLDRIVRASSSPGGLVADFFCGSGTTLVAAQQQGRRWLGCDSNPQAVRISRHRLVQCPHEPRPSEPRP